MKTMRVLISLAFFAGLMAAAFWPAMAQTLVCKSFQTMATLLERDFKELPVGRGLTTDGNLLVMFMSPGGKSFTFVQARPGEYPCIVTSGFEWTGLFTNLFVDKSDPT